MKHFKRTTLLCLFAVCAWTSALAWHEYQPMVVDGRVWDCGQTSYTIQGDTIIDAIQYKKAMSFSSQGAANFTYIGAVREYDHKVDIIFPDSFSPVRLYDFTVGLLNKGWMEVLQAANVIISGQERRLIMWSSGDITGFFVTIEGIGYNSKPFDFPWHNPGELIRCYDDDIVIYDWADNPFLTEVPYSMFITDGEVNGDDSVDISDVNAVIDMMLGRPMQPRWDDVAADMDLSGALDIADINAIIDKMLGK